MNYRIIYKIDQDFIYILAIIHGSRNISNINLILEDAIENKGFFLIRNFKYYYEKTDY